MKVALRDCHHLTLFVGCSTPFGINEGGTKAKLVDVLLGAGCSTPFGINEGGTRPSLNLVLAGDVLNAFRHQ